MKPCPECGEPPHYHSFCTLCAQLFRVKPEEPHVSQCVRRLRIIGAMRKRQMQAVFAAGMTIQQAMRAMNCSHETIRRWRNKLGMPSLTRKPYGRPRRALDV